MSERILPDTNVLGEIWNPRGLHRVKAAFAEVAGNVVLSVVVLGETLRGIHQLPPSRRRDGLQAYYDSLVQDYGTDSLPVTLEIAEAWGRMTAAGRRAGRTLHPSDGLIAATALVHDLTLWTRNTRDFDGTGVRLFNPWED
jgi:predicted nucleic acid-binding protein